ncbi:MAG: hypothetical protein KGI52_06590 [Burkholderiales bacterium]|nr:hypothetical protein [Burkholderiales bacterium]
MDGATIQQRIYAGRGKAALRIGLYCALWRPISPAGPLAQVTTLKAAFNAGDSTYHAANLPGDAIWYGDFDGTQTQPGDYLIRVSDGQTWFIAAQQQLLPIICIDCNARVRVTRQVAQAAVGALGYSGMVTANEVPVFGTAQNPWPASILFGGRKEASAGLPTSAKNTGWRIMLPPSVPATILASDIVIDALGRRFQVEGAESSDTGWRLIAHEVHA